MDDLVKRQITLVESKAKTSVAWGSDEPFNQPYYTWTNGKWQPNDLTSSTTTSNPTVATKPSPQTLVLYSWNIDYMLPYPDSRMRAALHHLHSHHISHQDPSFATAIFLNECLASDLTLLASTPWVRENFHITDLDGSNWASGHYGTTTLIDKRLQTERCFRVHYAKTRMQRDALFVDVNLGDPTNKKLLRLCNVHLESLAFTPPLRPAQMALCASYMHAPTTNAAILAGDLNAIQDFDQHLHTDNDLQDAFLSLGGRESDDSADDGGHTWGQQAATTQRERFGTSRMDKVLFCGSVELKEFEHFGADVVVPDADEAGVLVGLGFERAWVTDHLGVRAVFGLTK
ncbi:hypothetical protein LTR08_002232 [Meristemomyces frigidus]|nr:hypothetical protein LTR08_002232 [Meristemomyces frigidus]